MAQYGISERGGLIMIDCYDLDIQLEYTFNINPDTVSEDDINYILELAQDEIEYYGNTTTPNFALEHAIRQVLMNE